MIISISGIPESAPVFLKLDESQFSLLDYLRDVGALRPTIDYSEVEIEDFTE